MARPSNWNSPTVAIRVPAHAVDALMALAKQLDRDNVQNLPPEQPGPYILTTETYKDGVQRYLIQADADTPAEVWAEADLLVDKMCAGLDENGRMFLLSRLAQEWGRALDG